MKLTYRYILYALGCVLLIMLCVRGVAITDSIAGITPSWGGGADGELRVDGDVSTDRVKSAVTGNNPAGQKSILISDSSGFSAGDEVLIISMQDPETDVALNITGQYESMQIASISENTLSFYSSLRYSYNTDNGQKHQVIRVPHFTNVTVDAGGNITASSWNGETGGVLFFRASGKVTINTGGQINLDGKGYRGGEATDGGGYFVGFTGESIVPSVQLYTNENNIGGGGAGRGECGEASGAAGYGQAGTEPTGAPCSGDFTNHGLYGLAYGDETLTRLFLGSGGGGGSRDQDNCDYTAGHNGGGIIIIFSPLIEIGGTISSNGEGPSSNTSACVGALGGPGAGGSIFLSANDIYITGAAIAEGGAASDISASDIDTGKGGCGRIRIDCTILTNTGDITPDAFVNNPADQAQIWVSDEHLSLMVPTGVSQIQKGFIIKNLGYANLLIDPIAANNSHFTVSPTSADLSFQEGEEVVVTYIPTGIEVETGTLTIASNDPDNPNKTVVLQGAGSSVIECVPTLEICDGIDNDCDGQIDEGMTENDPGALCGDCGVYVCDGAGPGICQEQPGCDTELFADGSFCDLDNWMVEQRDSSRGNAEFQATEEGCYELVTENLNHCGWGRAKDVDSQGNQIIHKYDPDAWICIDAQWDSIAPLGSCSCNILCDNSNTGDCSGGYTLIGWGDGSNITIGETYIGADIHKIGDGCSCASYEGSYETDGYSYDEYSTLYTRSDPDRNRLFMDVDPPTGDAGRHKFKAQLSDLIPQGMQEPDLYRVYYSHSYSCNSSNVARMTTFQAHLGYPHHNQAFCECLGFNWDEDSGRCYRYAANIPPEIPKYYVDVNNTSGTEDGSEDYPFPTIQKAIDMAEDVAIIIVAPGIYYENINFQGKALRVTSSDPDDPDVVAATIIDGDQADSTVTFAHGEGNDSILKGFTLQNGGAHYGGGIFCDSSSPLIDQCIIKGNLAYSTLGNGNGGGIYCSFSSPIITNCTIAENSAEENGGGIYCQNSTATITNCLIIENLAMAKGQNEIPEGGGGIYCSASSPIITNCTISHNTSYGEGGGIHSGLSSLPIVINSILWGNISDGNFDEIYLDEGGSLNITYSDIQESSGVYPGIGNINVNPLFVDPVNCDYHLRVGSPCIDSGDLNTPNILEKDKDNNERIINGYIDMGAYEAKFFIVAPSGYQYTSIQAAIEDASDGYVISVNQGTYEENINFLGKAITVESSDPYDPVVVAATIIDGGKAGSVVTFNNGENENSILDGFTLQNGSAADGGGIYCEYSSPTITNCIIRRNESDDDGGGIYCRDSAPTISNCLIAYNLAKGLYGGGAPHCGGGIYCELSSPTITECIISFNTTYGNGGGIYCFYESSPTLNNCTISRNIARSYGGGIGCYINSSPRINNCTVYGNSAEYRGGGIYSEYYSSPTIINSIFWGDSVEGAVNEIHLEYYGSITVSYSDIQLKDGEDKYTGDNNINLDPLFVNSMQENYYLMQGSPCIDKGIETEDSPIDQVGIVRPQGGGVDMGAFEYVSSDSCIPRASFIVDQTEVNDSVTINFDASSSGGSHDEGTDFLWDFGDGTSGRGITISHAYSHCGLYDVSLTVTTTTCGTHSLTLFDFIKVKSSLPSKEVGKSGYTYTTIQEAIDDASYGELILVHDGIYVENIDFLGKTITVRSENGAEVTVIDGNGDGSIVTFNSGESDDSILDGFTLQNASTSDGGGIYCKGSSPTITNCIISGNTAYYYGGGIYCEYSDPTITNCTISNNEADFYDGGGIYFYYSDATIAECTISGNTAHYDGGGIYCEDSDPTITNCTISNNDAYYDNGGGIYFEDSDATITDCIISSNIADDYGGGMYCEDSDLTITNCTISNNEAYTDDGGGIYFEDSDATITDCSISNNIADDYGGGMYCDHSSFTLTNCMINDNICEHDEGGGIYFDYSDAVIAACTISGNIADEDGGGMYFYNSSSTMTNCTINNNISDYDGGGIYFYDSSSTMTNCTINGNICDDYGGGICCDYSDAIITNCTINNNIAEEYGGGICLYYSSSTMTNCTINNNISDYDGGGIDCENSDAIITDCTIIGNISDEDGGGIYFYDSSPTITNCVIGGNSAYYGGGIYFDYSDAITTNCTISRNIAEYDGGGIYNYESSLAFINSILWDDTAGGSYDEIYEDDGGYGGYTSVTYSNVQLESEEVYSGEGNINADPTFINSAEGDYYLMSASPCIDAGSTPDAPSSDNAGIKRPQGSEADMGAYEYIGVDLCIPRAQFTADKTIGIGKSGIVHFDALSSFGSLYPGARFSWDFGDGTSESGTNVNVSHTYSNYGSYDVTMTITTECGSDSITKHDYILLAQGLYSISSYDDFLHIISPMDASTMWKVQITLEGEKVEGGKGLAMDPTTGLLWAVLKLYSGERELVTIDPATGSATSIGTLSDYISGLAFDSVGTLYGVTGDGGDEAETLFILDKTNARLNYFMKLGNGDDGEGIAFNPDDGFMYHMSGYSGEEIFESINLDTGTITNIGIPFSNCVGALTYWEEEGVFLWSDDYSDYKLYRLTTTGVPTYIGPLDHRSKGLALPIKKQQGDGNIYVDINSGSDTEDGSEENPFKTIQGAIESARDGMIINVASGIYDENSILIDKAITIKSIAGPASTILNGSGDGSVVIFNSGVQRETILEGFTITSGWEEYGGGIVCLENASPIIKNNIIIDNKASSEGAGIFCHNGASPFIVNNDISNNTSDLSGGGIACASGSMPLIKDNSIMGNDGGYFGGALSCAPEATPIIANNIIVANESRIKGGAIYCLLSSPVIYNNTIVSNKTGGEGGGICCSDSLYSKPIIANCILWDNQGQDLLNCSATYSTISDGSAGEGTISEDPLFTSYNPVNPMAGDYSLKASSPCLNTGCPNPLFNDLDSSRNDMGAQGGNSILLSFPDHEFFDVPKGARKYANLHIENSGEADITIDGLSIEDTGNFGCETTAPLIVEAGTFADVRVVYHPDSLGEHTTYLHIMSTNFFGTGQVDIGLGGRCVTEHTSLSGSISGTLTLGLASSPYTVTGDIIVENGATLTIDPGVKVQFFESSLTVYGEIRANGSQDNPIVFTSASSSPCMGGWEGITFMQGCSDNCKLQYCQITGVRASLLNAQAAIQISKANPTIHNCVISNNQAHGIACMGDCALDLKDTTIAYNGRSGIYFECEDSALCGDSIVDNNNIFRNFERGITIASNVALSIQYNRIYDNHEEPLSYTHSDNLTLTNNTIMYYRPYGLKGKEELRARLIKLYRDYNLTVHTFLSEFDL
ncbi:MAG: right-handed parallel beta-helix repeat-containing protein [bacterium]